MYSSKTSIRVRYAETDRMGYAYYGNYAQYFEVARVEALREMGVSYRAMEDSGILLPVLEYEVKFFKPAYYDDVLTIETIIEELPGVRFKFVFKTFDSEGEQLNQGKVTLVFVNAETKKPCSVPEWLIDILKKKF